MLDRLRPDEPVVFDEGTIDFLSPAPEADVRRGVFRRIFLSLSRIFAVFAKEFLHLWRDKISLALVIGVPILQLILFGYAINLDPKQLPTVVLVNDQSFVARAVAASLEATGYFKVVGALGREDELDAAIANGAAAFAITIPSGFARSVLRGDQVAVLVEADAADPSATAQAIMAAQEAVVQAVNRELTRAGLGDLVRSSPVEVRVHRRYNPESITQYNIVPGLVGVVLTLSLVMMSAMSLAREVEKGTMETLLILPLTRFKIIIGKIAAYVALAMVQTGLVLTAALYVFNVPFVGSFATLMLVIFSYIAALVAIGLFISTIARTQMQAMQYTIFYFLPSVLLSGFMFPFQGMPHWARVIGEGFPLTHFLRGARGIMLKGNDLPIVLPHIVAMGLITLVIGFIGFRRYRSTLD